jgi:hypothetical protein
MIEFEAWPKTPRLFKEGMVITEKIDGTNSAVGVMEFPFGWHVGGVDENGVNHDPPENAVLVMGPLGDLDGLPDVEYLVYAQSRNRLIKPAGKFAGEAGTDNYAFAEWVWKNADELARVLGPGLHFGEWWGAGIGRGYGQTGRHFSLFNTSRWKHLAIPEAREAIGPPAELSVVPVLAVHTLDTDLIKDTLDALKFTGSHAAPGYENPEGICVYLPAVRATFKVTFDDEHKGVLREHKLDVEALAEIGA